MSGGERHDHCHRGCRPACGAVWACPRGAVTARPQGDSPAWRGRWRSQRGAASGEEDSPAWRGRWRSQRGAAPGQGDSGRGGSPANGGASEGETGRFPLRGDSGSLLVITLWLVTILSVLAVAIARYLSTEVRLTRYRVAREQARALARSGVYLAMQRLEQDAQGESDGKTYDWLGDDWAVFPSGDPADPAAWVVRVQPSERQPERPPHEIRIRMTDEERRLNISAATLAQLSSIVQSSELAQAVLDDVDQDSIGETPVEQPPYYAPKNGPVAALEELLDIPRMTPEAFRSLQQSTAVFEGVGPAPTVNINTAEGEVLLALGGDSTVARALVANRAGLNGVFGDADDCKATDLAHAAIDLANCALGGNQPPLVALLSTSKFSVSSSTFRIAVDVLMQPAQAPYHITAVVRRSGDPASPSTIVSWREG